MTSAKDFFDLLFPDIGANFIEIRTLPTVRQFFCSTTEDAAQTVESLPNTNVHFGTCLRNDRIGDEQHSSTIGALWADVDFKDFEGGQAEARKRILAFEFNPSIAVGTGNGWHFYWVLKEPEEINSKSRPYFRGILDGIATALGGDRACKDLARVFRVPGTNNVKDPSDPKPVEIIRWNPDCKYNHIDFEHYYEEKSGQAATAPIEGRIQQGGRNGTLTSIAGTMRRGGMSEDAIFAALQVENASKCEPPIFDGELRAIARSVTRYSPEPCSPPPLKNGEEENKVITLKTRGAEDLIKYTIEVAWLVNGVLPVGRCMLLTGPSGTGKSWLSLDLAIAVDQGDLWLGRFQCQQGVVLVVDEENGDALLKRRLTRMLKGRGLDSGGNGCGIQFLSMAGVNLSDGACVAALERVLSELRPALVIFDTFVRVHQGDESSAKDMAPISRLIKEWFVAYGCAFCINHHDRKPGASGHDAKYAFRGSTEIQAFTDSHLDLRPVKNEDGRLNVTHAKARFAEAIEPFGVEIVDVDEGVIVRHTEEHQGQAGKIEETTDLICNLATDWVSRQEVLRRGDELKLSEKTLDAARKRLVDTGKMEEKKEGNQILLRMKPMFSPSHTPIGEENNIEDSIESERFQYLIDEREGIKTYG